MSSLLKLILSLDGQVVREVELSKDRTTLGRRPYNDVVIDNLAVSGEHAVLQRIGESVFLEDLNSTNGTYVNRKPVKRQMLDMADVIEIGRYRLQFARTEVVAEAPPLPSFGTIADLSSAPAARETVQGEISSSPPPEPTLMAGALNKLARPPVSPAPAPVPAAVQRDAEGLVVCRMRILSGSAHGKIMPLAKARTTLGKPGVQVAAIVRGPEGVEVHIDDNRRTLQSGDALDIAGTRIEILIP